MEVVERLRGIRIASRIVHDAPSGLESFRAHPGVVIFSFSPTEYLPHDPESENPIFCYSLACLASMLSNLLNSRMGRWIHYPAFKQVKVWTLSFQMNYQSCSNSFCSQT